MAAEKTETRPKPTEEQVMEVMQEIEDPELRLSIVDLGLVYGIDINDEGLVHVTITLTFPGCPFGPVLGGEIYSQVMEIPGVADVDVDVVFDPPWDPKTMASEEVKEALGIW